MGNILSCLIVLYGSSGSHMAVRGHRPGSLFLHSSGQGSLSSILVNATYRWYSLGSLTFTPLLSHTPLMFMSALPLF